ncbi:hypothetical protein AHMF7605_12045 [Adhaeribacter arboris]|uniref:Phage integrase SAM-like domain-containing protein n=1 Tax=Adhaeribacter arboris TaxID=2072846 RepID=A0A2T2YFC5_9BACT|nr:phage integrase SAM-like domain-containing protein [Adhaeribacter arboris]PSR54202.1 hypothetical protein AHMF7605_12045 [Adhaeribacter arboris]
MISISFYPDKPKANKTIIMVRVFPGDARTSTGISFDPHYWTGDDLYVKPKEKRANYIRARLKEIDAVLFQECSRLHDKGERITSRVLDEILRPGKRQKLETVREYYQQWKKEYLEEKNRGNKTNEIKGLNYTRVQKQVVDRLEKFKPSLTPKDITKPFVTKYFNALYEEGEIQDSTIRRHQKFLRLILKYVNLPYEWIKVDPETEASSFDLYWSEVLALKNATYSSKEIEEAAHTFVIACQLGLRWSDLSTLKAEHFLQVQSQKHGAITVISKNQSKTTNQVYIPIPPLAQGLIRHHGRIPVPSSITGSKLRHYYSSRLKVACEEAGLNRMVQQSISINNHVTVSLSPIFKVISSHNARHTAASRIFEATKNEALKEKILGHKMRHDPIRRCPVLS